MATRKNKTTKSKFRRRKSIKRGGAAENNSNNSNSSFHEMRHAFNYFNKSIDYLLRDKIHQLEGTIMRNAEINRIERLEKLSNSRKNELNYPAMSNCFKDALHASMDSLQQILGPENSQMSLNDLRKRLEPIVKANYKTHYEITEGKYPGELLVDSSIECKNILDGLLKIAKMVRPKL